MGRSLNGGKYVIDGVLGHGGFSVVYSAKTMEKEANKQITEKETVAVKEIVINSGGTRTSKQSILKHIVSEIDLLRSLDHPNIVKCLDFFVDGGKIYVVLEAFPGDNLRNYIEKYGPMKEEQIIDVALQCCSILTYLHTRPKPVIHRDFTPDNLIKTASTVKLIDFNVAEEANASSSQTIVGKQSYLAPEQWCGKFTTAGDLYQLGCSLYFLAMGKDPEPLTQSAPSTSTVSHALSEIIQRLTAREEESRFESATELSQELQRIREILPSQC